MRSRCAIEGTCAVFVWARTLTITSPLTFTQIMRIIVSNKLKLSVSFIGLSFLLCFLTPWALFAVVFAFLLFAFVVWTEIYTENQIQRINSEIQGLKDKISALQLSKGMGR